MSKVLAHFMHVDEKTAALNALQNAVGTDSYVFGETDNAGIKGLEAEGLVVQILEDDPAAETPGLGSTTHRGMRGRSPGRRRRLRPRGGRNLEESEPNYYLVSIVGPLLPDWSGQLVELNVELLERMGRFAYTAFLTPEQVQDIAALPWVNGVDLYTAEDTAPDEPRRQRAGGRRARSVQREMMTWDVILHRDKDLQGFTSWLEEMQVDVAGTSGRKARVYLIEGSPLYNEVRERREVRSIEPYVPPEIHNDVARQILGIDPKPRSNPGHGIAQTGKGQLVGVADTGLDDAHPDFKGRIVTTFARGRKGVFDDPHGHGTHVAGSVLGDGRASGGMFKGTAPKAQLVFQSLLRHDGRLEVPVDLGVLFQEAYDAGARIHNNSWGSATNSRYTSSSLEVDQFVHDNPDIS